MPLVTSTKKPRKWCSTTLRTTKKLSHVTSVTKGTTRGTTKSTKRTYYVVKSTSWVFTTKGFLPSIFQHKTFPTRGSFIGTTSHVPGATSTISDGHGKMEGSTEFPLMWGMVGIMLGKIHKFYYFNLH